MDTLKLLVHPYSHIKVKSIVKACWADMPIICTAKPHSTRVQSAITERKEQWSSDYFRISLKRIIMVSKFRGTYKFKECTFFLALRCHYWLRRGHSSHHEPTHLQRKVTQLAPKPTNYNLMIISIPHIWKTL